MFLRLWLWGIWVEWFRCSDLRFRVPCKRDVGVYDNTDRIDPQIAGSPYNEDPNKVPLLS